MDSYEYANDNEVIVSCEWVMELMTNSCTLELNKSISYTFETMEIMEQELITFVKIALDEMFFMSNSFISGLHKYLENFPSVGLNKTRGENVTNINAELLAVSERLCEVKDLPSETTSNVLTGLNKCIVPGFKGLYELVLKSERLDLIESDSSQVGDRKTLAKVKKIFLMANKEYKSINVSGKWNITGGYCHDHILGACFDCDSSYHIFLKYLHPNNEEKIKGDKEE